MWCGTAAEDDVAPDRFRKSEGQGVYGCTVAGVPWVGAIRGGALEIRDERRQPAACFLRRGRPATVGAADELEEELASIRSDGITDRLERPAQTARQRDLSERPGGVQLLCADRPRDGNRPEQGDPQGRNQSDAQHVSPSGAGGCRQRLGLFAVCRLFCTGRGEKQAPWTPGCRAGPQRRWLRPLMCEALRADRLSGGERGVAEASRGNYGSV